MSVLPHPNAENVGVAAATATVTAAAIFAPVSLLVCAACCIVYKEILPFATDASRLVAEKLESARTTYLGAKS